MGFVVKNTTKFTVLDLIAPHSCRGCGRLGAVVCECCKNNILDVVGRICPLCKETVDTSAEKCQNCVLSCREIFAAVKRTGWLGHLIGEYKMQSVRAAKGILVEILGKVLEQSSLLRVSRPVVIVPLPTIRKHVRERGLDHTLAIAKGLAARRGCKVQKLLGRSRDSVQVGSSKAQRKTQAKVAYELLTAPDLTMNYLLLDDIWTTGASMLSVIELLAAAGVPREQIFGAVIAVSE